VCVNTEIVTLTEYLFFLGLIYDQAKWNICATHLCWKLLGGPCVSCCPVH